MQDITVSNTGSSGIRINDASFVTVENSNISSVGNNGMDIRDSFDIAVSGTNIDGVTGIYAGIWIDNVNDFSFNHSHIRNVNNYGLSLNNLNTISGAGNSMSNVTTPCDHDSFTNGSIDFVSINDGAGGHCP